MTFQLSDEEQAALQSQAEVEGISMQDAARQAVREYVARHQRQARVSSAAEHIMTVHADALERLGQ